MACAALWIVQDEVVSMNIRIGESHQLSNTLTASSKMKTQKSAAVVIQVLDVLPVCLQSTKIDWILVCLVAMWVRRGIRDRVACDAKTFEAQRNAGVCLGRFCAFVSCAHVASQLVGGASFTVLYKPAHYVGDLLCGDMRCRCLSKSWKGVHDMELEDISGFLVRSLPQVLEQVAIGNKQLLQCVLFQFLRFLQG
ncbi:hypothetical protein MA05_15950 [Comamonas aquatica]|nr:hypothetical protein MA05_15950 [Comamonas aquatica]